MKKYILLLLIALLSVNLASAQFECNISSLVKQAGEMMTKKEKNPKDISIIGDYRENGSGWVLLPDHTGAFFIQNIKAAELLWALHDSEKGLVIAIIALKNDLDADGKLQVDKQTFFLVNIVSHKEIEFLDTQTFQTLKMHKKIKHK